MWNCLDKSSDPCCATHFKFSPHYCGRFLQFKHGNMEIHQTQTTPHNISIITDKAYILSKAETNEELECK